MVVSTLSTIPSSLTTPRRMFRTSDQTHDCGKQATTNTADCPGQPRAPCQSQPSVTIVERARAQQTKSEHPPGDRTNSLLAPPDGPVAAVLAFVFSPRGEHEHATIGRVRSHGRRSQRVFRGQLTPPPSDGPLRSESTFLRHFRRTDETCPKGHPKDKVPIAGPRTRFQHMQPPTTDARTYSYAEVKSILPDQCLPFTERRSVFTFHRPSP